MKRILNTLVATPNIPGTMSLAGRAISLTDNLVGRGFKVQDGVVLACNGAGLVNLLRAGQVWLERHLEIVNALNVFPVPDGDTGINMLLTIRAAVEQAGQVSDSNVDTVAAAAARGALMGARGNSGVILSQLLRGIARRLERQRTFTAQDWAGALQVGVDLAYQSVVKPVEGTILTVARAAAQSAHASAMKSADLLRLFQETVAAAEVAQAGTPDLLPVLKEAGVTDSGGLGLVYILQGCLRFLRNESLEDPPDERPSALVSTAPDASAAEYGYDVQFLIQGRNLDVDSIRAGIDACGWSTVVVGDESLVKVHVHTDDPGRPISFGADQGVVKDVVVEYLTEQARQFLGDLPTSPAHSAVQATSGPTFQSPARAVGVLATASGPGLAEILRSLGVARVIVLEPDDSPDADALLEQVNQIPVDNVLILPNSGKVLMSARRIEARSSRVRVAPTRSEPQAIAAMLSFDPRLDLETNLDRMVEAVRQVQTIVLRRSARERIDEGVHVMLGDVAGWLNGRLVAAGQDYPGLALALLEQANVDSGEVVTIYYGRACSAEAAEALARLISQQYTDVEVEVYSGGQADSEYILSVE